MTSAIVKLYGTNIATVAWDPEKNAAIFQYAPSFFQSQIEVAPVMMPLSPAPYAFPHLNTETFKGLPGMLADALPDKFGNLLIDQWLAKQDRRPESFNPVERLCYLGNRAMGALEFEPTTHAIAPDRPLEIAALVSLATDILAHRSKLSTEMVPDHEEEALADILRVGTSAGGARAKAVIAWNPTTNQIRSGQTPLEQGFEPWLVKFDGVAGNSDKELDDPRGYGRIEYAYHLMALEAGISMSECRLLEESGRAHFMTRRFDRTQQGDKLHLQTLCALGHYDFNQAGGYSYEQSFQIARLLSLGYPDLEELYRRAIFNILARNQDDHTKNISFMMDRSGRWSLAPAYDITYSYNPSGAWTSQHQMTFNSKRDGFDMDDLLQGAARADVKPRRAKAIISKIQNAIDQWSRHAYSAGVPSGLSIGIAKQFRTIR
ncbi:type II toxin-antitoxin system HipA family toxin [Akkermansiaceae bacterium]|nr:type II toxin-antitoxin system HipA family toxin [Akkermansiaceae bacterium]